MIVDAHRLPDNAVIETEVCIVGAGPAGITLAQELAGQDFRVCLLESGGWEPNEEVQELASSPATPIEELYYPKADFMRRRQLGGTANVWAIAMNGIQKGVRYVPLEEIDFEKRDWVPNSGWPINKTDLDPYYARAHKVCQIGTYSNRVEDWQDGEAVPLNLGNRITTRMFHVGSREVFTQHYLSQFKQSENITLYYNATAVELETSDTARMVERVRVASLNGKSFQVVAKIVILAQGAIDNARLLLLSDRVQTAGLGNEYDVVGRYFMDHPVVRAGLVIPKNRNIFDQTALYDLRQKSGSFVIGQMSLTEETLRREHLLHTTTSIFPLLPIHRFNLRRILFPQGKRYKSAAVEAGIMLKRDLRKGKISGQTFNQLWQILTGMDDLVYFFGRKRSISPFALPYRYGYDDNGWSYETNKSKRYGLFEVIQMTEQAPDPDNRVVLAEERDRLGCRKAKLQMRWNEIDRRSIRRTQDIFAEDIVRSGLGRLKLELDRDDPHVVLPSAHHNMGTTRMHANPRYGVVDANCKVHSVSNLFIASSSVFPTSSYANPTLTIVAMAIRLADHVKQMMSKKVTVTLSGQQE
jgi:choline dehydrogenase-like flavoprotein